jgi:hypothetical protein
VKIHVLTRGYARHLDYSYLGSAPSEWWRPLREWATVDRPATFAQGTGGGVRVLLAGIPSVRRDALGRAIRFTLVLEAGVAEGEECAELVRASLTEGGRARIGEALDGELSPKEIDALLGGDRRGEGVEERAWTAVKKALTDLEPAPEETVSPKSRVPAWVGSIHDHDAEEAFVARVRQLATGGQEGWAATLNLVRDSGRAEEIAAELDKPAALLLPEEVVKGVQPLRGKAGPAPHETPRDRRLPPRGRPGQATVLRVLLVAVPLIAASALVLTVIRWLAGRG